MAFHALPKLILNVVGDLHFFLPVGPAFAIASMYVSAISTTSRREASTSARKPSSEYIRRRAFGVLKSFAGELMTISASYQLRDVAWGNFSLIAASNLRLGP